VAGGAPSTRIQLQLSLWFRPCVCVCVWIWIWIWTWVWVWVWFWPCAVVVVVIGDAVRLGTGAAGHGPAAEQRPAHLEQPQPASDGAADIVAPAQRFCSASVCFVATVISLGRRRSGSTNICEQQ
jgi:hypothetical protein